MDGQKEGLIFRSALSIPSFSEDQSSFQPCNGVILHITIVTMVPTLPIVNYTPHLIHRELTHGQMLAKHLVARRPHLPPNPVLVETGCRRSTLALAESGRALNATVYSCDMNAKKIAALKQ